MAMMHEKSHAREGRGAGNGGNENWYNSPLWKNSGPKRQGTVKTEPEPELTPEQAEKRRLQAILRSIY